MIAIAMNVQYAVRCFLMIDKSTPTNTSLRDIIYSVMNELLAGSRHTDPLDYNGLVISKVDKLEALLTAKTTEAEQTYYFKGYRDGRTSLEAEQLQQLDKGEA